ncbi:MAG: hypothetical protein F4117_07710 [Acidimicrobiales bacterium]|nr:hypothetical protein [Acidimicrobiales bacterium]MYB80018.1 hypothetical protein [Acidimicrobiales bacterium]MYI12436.1 hypothetical protein [Acidimicrobiales bacterium]
MDGAYYPPRQVVLDIGEYCIVGVDRNGQKHLLLFEHGRELSSVEGATAIVDVYRPDETLLRSAETVADQGNGAPFDEWLSDDFGNQVIRDDDGFWLNALGSEASVEYFASTGAVSSGDLLLMSTRPFSSHQLRWLTTPHEECDAYPHAYVPDYLPG